MRWMILAPVGGRFTEPDSLCRRYAANRTGFATGGRSEEDARLGHQGSQRGIPQGPNRGGRAVRRRPRRRSEGCDAESGHRPGSALDDQRKAAIAVLKGHQSDFDAYEQTPSDHDKCFSTCWKPTPKTPSARTTASSPVAMPSTLTETHGLTCRICRLSPMNSPSFFGAIYRPTNSPTPVVSPTALHSIRGCGKTMAAKSTAVGVPGRALWWTSLCSPARRK